jgi:hypothetical protein
MPVPAVRLKIRVRLANGSRAYVDPVFSSNGKLKPLYAVVNGKPASELKAKFGDISVRAVTTDDIRQLKAGWKLAPIPFVTTLD